MLGESIAKSHEKIIIHKAQQLVLNYYTRTLDEDGRLKLISVYGLKTTRRRYWYAPPHGLLSSLSAVVFSTSPPLPQSLSNHLHRVPQRSFETGCRLHSTSASSFSWNFY
ncbi:hypothetical protein V1478_000465 [Vespula squamosa]|uniref:NTF2 domain-containing protein n=1 Tax=Vespula squamosa TaxID=30214 RepID=A0ABD2C6F3_VESSQ